MMLPFFKSNKYSKSTFHAEDTASAGFPQRNIHKDFISFVATSFFHAELQ